VPLRLKTRCRYPGCSEIVRGRFCDQHAQTYARRSDQRRGNSAERGYDVRWSRLAEHRRQLDCFLCQPCLAEQRLTSSRTVDHIIPLHVRPDWRLEIGNTQVICTICHQRKTASDTRRYGSSTAQRLNNTQQQARHAARIMLEPPRAGNDEGPQGGSLRLDVSSYDHAVPTVRAAAKLGAGGSAHERP